MTNTGHALDPCLPPHTLVVFARDIERGQCKHAAMPQSIL